jgi:serpin B
MKKTISIIAVCMLAIGTLCACDKNNPEDPEVETKPFEPIVLTKAEQEISNASNRFGFDIYHNIYNGNNILISPLSLSLALSMTANGAEGKTAE